MKRTDLAKELTTKKALLELRRNFLSRGFDIRFVGGCVRDALNGQAPKDIDFCTDADPSEQRAIYSDFGWEFIPTGEQHGTFTVMIDGEAFEITSLRTEAEHDGRYATMSYTRDWIEDLSRRDLTFNAMALTFEGELVDPFGGQNDLASGSVRFVGNAEERIQEDFLRIMRFFRFTARFGSANNVDESTITAIKKNIHGMSRISGERIWSELSKILVLAKSPEKSFVLHLIRRVGLFEAIGLPEPSIRHLHEFTKVQKSSSHPSVLMACFFDSQGEIDAFRQRAKFSKKEWQIMSACLKFKSWTPLDIVRETFVESLEKDTMARVLEFVGDRRRGEDLVAGEFPSIPVSGNDLASAGLRGPEIGAAMKKIRQLWFDSKFSAGKDQMILSVTQ